MAAPRDHEVAGESPTAGSPIEGPLDELEKHAMLELGDDFAGVWMNADGPVVASVRRAGTVPSVDGVPVRGVTHSKAQLEAAKVVLGEQGKRIVDDGTPLTGWWVDLPNNALKVQVIDPTNLDDVGKHLARYIGDIRLDVEVVPGPMILE